MIQSLSQRPDRDQFQDDVAKMLGLRGHMYGELLRIQVMLAKNDPEMNVISLQFNVSLFRLSSVSFFRV